MKKKVSVILTILLLLSVLAGCSSAGGKEETGASASQKDIKDQKIVILCEKIGTSPFLKQMQTEFENLIDEYGFQGSIVECADASVWEESARASVMEGNDLVIVVAWQGVGPIEAVATEFPDDAKYVLVDVGTENPNIKSITFREQESAYLVGMLAGLINPNNKFGAVYVDDTELTWRWEWGFMEGVKAVRDDAIFMKNYTNSYYDAAKAKELALQQAAAGCGYIFAASASADMGTFEAAKEKGFYTNSQDVYLGDESNPYIVTAQLKNMDIIVERIVTDFLNGTFTTEPEVCGIKEGAIGATYITEDDVSLERNPVITDEILEKVKKAAEDIKNGTLVLDVPSQE